MRKIQQKGFTLIELLVVIAIIAVLAGLVIIRVGDAAKRARDSRRLAEIDEIKKALNIYKIKHGRFPAETDDDHFGWDIGYAGSADTQFIEPLVSDGIMSKVPGDPIWSNKSTGEYVSGYGYRYAYYSAGHKDCDISKGGFYVLGVGPMESVVGKYPSSPGFKCPLRDWEAEGQYVTGDFEN